MIKINMRSAANVVKGQGVGSCYEEQVELVKSYLNDKYKVSENAKGKFDIIHYHTVNLNYYFEVLLKRRSSISVGYVHFLPDTLDESLKLPWLYRKVFYRYILAFYNSMDYLVTVNPSIVKKIEDYGITKPKVCCIPNFVSEKNFYPKSNAESEIFRLKYGVPTDKFVVLGSGQLQKRKGIFDFIETAKKCPNAYFVWAGGFSFGKISDGYNEIKSLMQNPPENVKFLGIVDRSEMVDVYNMADTMFLPSFDELFPMAILEALCCKKPVLLRDIDVYKGILGDGYLRGKNSDEFANAVNSLISDNAQVEYWKEKSWEYHKLYSEETASKQWDVFYQACFDKVTNPQILLGQGNTSI